MAADYRTKNPRVSYGPDGKGRKVTPAGGTQKWELASTWRADYPHPEFMRWLVAECAASGYTPRQICMTHSAGPSYRTMMAWVATDPDYERQYLAAQRSAMHCRIEKLVQEAELLMSAAKAGALQKDQVNAFNAFAKTIQWVAGKWNKETYGEHREMKTVVPVQIVTNLDFGQPGLVRDKESDLYEVTVEATVLEPEPEGEDE